MIEQPYNGRADIRFDGLKLEIQIPSKKNWFIILFLIVWMGGWFMGETSALNEIRNTDDIFGNSFILFWLIGWTLSGGFAIAVLLWSILGKETISIDRDILELQKGILDFGISSKKYDLTQIKNLELNPDQNITNIFAQKKIGDFWGMTGGKLRFDYGMKTIKFGIGIDEAEARFLIDEIVKKGYYKFEK